MGTKYSFLRADYWVQTILGVMIIACCASVVGIMFGLLLAIPFGACQVISGLSFGIANQDKRRFLYLSCVGVFFVLWYFISIAKTDVVGLRDWSFALLVVLAAALGIWYYILTRKEYKNYDPKADYDEINEDILDA